MGATDSDSIPHGDRVVEKDHDTALFHERQRKIQETQGLNQAVAHFMLDARECFDNRSQPEIQAIAMEIAMIGVNGIGPEKSGYSVKSVPGQKFTGNRLLAWYNGEHMHSRLDYLTLDQMDQERPGNPGQTQRSLDPGARDETQSIREPKPLPASPKFRQTHLP